ncbi:MAG: hypothetical protein AAGC55_32880, partial [Myxococcota bacterium]
LSAILDAIAAHPDRAGAQVRAWMLTTDEFSSTVMPGYDQLYEPYTRAYAQASNDLERALQRAASTGGRAVYTRTQYAEDPHLSSMQIWLRWALPTGNPGAVAFVGPAVTDATADAGFVPAYRLDPVWVHTGSRWALLLGLERAPADRIRVRAPCADRLDPSCRVGRCLVEIYQVYQATLTGDEEALVRACAALSDRPIR